MKTEYKLAKPAPGTTARNYENVLFTAIHKQKKAPASVIIPSIDEVYVSWVDKDGVEHSELKMIRAAQGEKSIWADEQSEGAEKRLIPIVFQDGLKIVNEKEVTLMKYLEVCSFNAANADVKLPGKPTLFRANDADKKAEEALLLDEKKTRLKTLVYDMDDDETEGLALSFNLPFKKGKTGVAQAKHRFVQMIDYDPIRFETEVKSEKRQLRLVLIRAIERGVISFDERDNIFYNEVGSKTRLLECPSYVDALDYFVDLSLSREEYKSAFEEIKRNLSGKVGSKAKADKGLPKYDETEEYELFNEAMRLGIIVNDMGNIKCVIRFVGSLGQDAKSAVETLRANPSKTKAIKKAIEDKKSDIDAEKDK